MQTAIRSSIKSSACSVAPRHACGMVAPVGRRASRASSVTVYAKGKGKGRGRMGTVPGQTMQVRQEPPTPEVDPDNAEFVVFIRATDFYDDQMKVQMNASQWVPLTIVKGGQAANFLCKAMESEWGRKLYGKTLIKNIAQACYKDRDQIERGLKQQYPNLRKVPSSNFQYAMKIRDKSVPKDWYKDNDLTVFPPESEVSATALDDLKKFFSPASLGSMFA